MGSVSEGVVHHARVPVLVMRGGVQAWPPSRIVVADDTFEDTEADKLAAHVAGLFGAEVILVRVYQGLLADSRGGKDLTSRMVDDALRREEEALNERTDKMEDALGKRPRTRALVGDPAASLLQMDQEDEKPVLLAVGGLGPYEHVRIGSVPDKVMRAARGPFLFIPGTVRRKYGRTASSRARKRSVWK
jgi:nucleotide-binding universal stress UspA family protein